MITRVGHVAIEVPDLAASVAFHQRFVGLSERLGTEERSYLTCNDRHHELILIQSPAGITGLDHVAFEVEPGTLDEAVARALAAGATRDAEIDEPGVDRAVVIVGPFGMRMKFFEGMAILEAPESDGGIAPIRFEHFNLTAPDIAELSRFLAEGLGMRFSDRLLDDEGLLISWQHLPVRGSDHHGVAALRWPEAKLHHVKWEYPSTLDVVRMTDRYAEAGRLLVWGMGRHGVDGSLFSYIEDPCGLMIEIGVDMIRIGEDPRWTGPQDRSLDNVQDVNMWGAPVPDAWLAHGISLAPRAHATLR
jgi:catechol 2,3-dioxygenase-like lactoylglutathione lyase family enzyme